MYTNADMLSNKMNLLKLGMAANGPDIVCVNEVKPKNYRYEPFAAESSIDRSNRFGCGSLDYEFLPNNLENKVGRGQAIYFKNFIDAKQNNDIIDIILSLCILD